MSSQQQQQQRIIDQTNKIKILENSITNRTFHPKTKSQIESELTLAKKRLNYLKKPQSISPSPQRPSRKAPTLPPDINPRSTNTTNVKNKRPSHNTSRSNRRNASQRHQERARTDPRPQQEMTQCNKKIQDFEGKYKLSKQSRTSMKEFNKEQLQREKEKEVLLSYLDQQENCKRFIDKLNSKYENHILDTLRHGLWAFIKQLPTNATNFKQLEKDFDQLQPGPNSLHKFLNKYKNPESLKRINKSLVEFEKDSKSLIDFYSSRIKNQQHITEFNLQKEHTLKLIPFLKTTIANAKKNVESIKIAKDFADGFLASLNTWTQNKASLSNTCVRKYEEMPRIKKRMSKK